MPLMPILILAGGMMLVLVMLVMAFSGPSTGKAQSRRLEILKERYSTSSSAAVQAQMRRILAQRETTKLDSAVARFIPNPTLMRKRIAMTGRDWSLTQYGLVSLAITVVVAALVWLKGMPIAMALLSGIFLGAGLPYFVVGILIKRRIAAFNARFPDAIDLLVRGLRSGLPISETLGVVASEVPGPVGVEFRAVADKMKIGRTMEAALQDTADRIGTPEFQFFVITLAIQRETGGNLAETLSNLSDVLRKRAQMKLKIKAMSSESKASAYIVGALPFIVFGLVFWMNPAYLSGFFSDPRLIIAGIGGMIWMSIGGFIMAKMVNFEI
ncbi:type II secretion system F family protein [Flavisphingomonas formosensis]|uniref:type II secretion system F family protein n=1 Tax=Flavisphingomonas formosensis TaxID=861534 RepID=UPI0012FA9303|nr:type II secretion system F family protein [Sphingomonas formosensis]